MPGTRPGMTTEFAKPAPHDVQLAHWGIRTFRPSLLGLAGVLHGLEGLELDIVEFTVLLLDLADVDVLDDVAGLGIDRDRTARALPFHALHGLDQLVAVGVAFRL